MKNIIIYIYIYIAMLALPTNIVAQSLVGSLGGQFDVNDMGAATYSIPIEVPVGINGVQPDINLVYNSQGGNDICGYGFSLAVSSSITRIPRSIYYDGSAKGINYDKTDAYALDGQRMLLVSGTEGTNGAVYNLENDPLIIITLMGEGASQWFEVVQNGVTMRYGKGSSAKQLPNSSRNSIWYLEYLEDIHGNFINYAYSVDNYKNYLQSIYYGKNKSTLVDNYNVVLFNYETRPDVEWFTIGGSSGKITKRLKNIMIMPNGSPKEIYNLVYSNNDAFSRLSKITKSLEGKELCVNSFTWKELPTNISYETTSTASLSPIDKGDKTIVADYNGDGIDDIAVISNYDLNVYEKEATSNSFKNIFKHNFRYINNKYNEKNLLRQESADIYGKGEQSIIVPAKINDNYKLVFYSYSKSKGLDSTTIITSKENCDPIYAFADFDNDGKEEGILIERYNSDSSKSYSVKMLRIGSSVTNNVIKRDTYTLDYVPKQIIPSDFNNDGMIDIMIIFNNGYQILFNKGGLSGLNQSNSLRGTFPSGVTNVDVGDFNGDGNFDLVYIGDYYCSVYLNSGDCTFSKAFNYDLPNLIELGVKMNGNKKHTISCSINDYNNDGLDDIQLRHQFNYDFNFCKIATYKLISSGESFSIVDEGVERVEIDKVYTTTNSNGIKIEGDFDGDGHKDKLESSKIEKTTSYTRYSGWQLKKQSGVFPSSGKIVVINGDYYRQIEIEYASLSDPSVYNKSNRNISYPLTTTQLAFPVVKSVELSVGGNNQTTTFFYQDLCVHLQGRGVVGFLKQTSTNKTIGETKTEEILDWSSKVYIPTKRKITTSIGSYLSSEESELILATSNTKEAGQGFRYIISKMITSLTDIYKNVTTITETRNSTYGYIISSQTSNDGGKFLKTTTYGNYIQIGGKYRPQSITYSSVIYGAPSYGSTCNETTYKYDSRTCDLLEEVEYSNLPNKITHTYTYDKFGNILTSSTSGNGVSSVSEKYEYDSTKCFVKKKINTTTGQVISYSFDTYGRPINEIDLTNSSSPLSNVFTYDQCGNILTSKTPEGIVTTYSYGWGNTANKRYYVSSKTEGNPKVTIWYDELGREVLTESVGELGMQQKVSTTYDVKGLASQTTTTHGTLEIVDKYSYDILGRVISHTNTSGMYETFSYGNRTITATKGGRSTKQITDAWGNVTSVTDPAGTITTYKYWSDGKINTITSGGSTTTIEYDKYGRRYLLHDPNFDKPTSFTYDGFGRIVQTKDARDIITSYSYDNVGRLDYIIQGGEKTSYTYLSATSPLPISISNANSTIKYTYDAYKRIISKTVITGNETMQTRYEYDSLNQLSAVIYPNGSTEYVNYDDNGFVKQIQLNGSSIWELKSSTGQKRTVARGGNIQTITSWNTQGLLSSQQLLVKDMVKNTLSYSIDGKTGDLLSRNGMIGVSESFAYDNMDRLKEVKNGSTSSMTMSYAANGNITFKTGVGKYTYDSSRPQAVTKVENSGNVISHENQQVTFTPFNKVSTVLETINNKNNKLVISYGPGNQRCKTDYSIDGSICETRYYADNFERVIKGGTKTDILYISTPDGLTYIQSGTNGYQVMTDNLGSIVKMYDSNGVQKYSASYDAWGKQTVSSSVTGLRRGYGGHEHWNEFGLIDMNGRMYDPILGRFMSPDILVQNTKNSQNFNRYSYCLNNPLKYTDPSGYKTVPALVAEGSIELFSSCGRGMSISSYNAAFRASVLAGESYPRYADCCSMGNYGFNFSGYGISGLSQSDYHAISMMTSVTQIANYLKSINYPMPVQKQIVYEAQMYPCPFNGDGEPSYGSSDLYYYNLAKTFVDKGVLSVFGKSFTLLGIATDMYSWNSLGYAKSITTESIIAKYPNLSITKAGSRASKLKLDYTATSKLLSKIGNTLIVAGMAITAVDGFSNGFENHHFADLLINGAILAGCFFSAPYVALIGVVYSAADLYVTHRTGKSITEHLFD